jgi:hypothetical protein
MRTVTVSSIVTNAASRAGLDGSSIDNLPTTTKTIMVDNLSSHLRDAWEFYDWPDLTRTEERTVQTGVDEDIYIDLAQASETEIGDVFRSTKTIRTPTPPREKSPSASTSTKSACPATAQTPSTFASGCPPRRFPPSSPRPSRRPSRKSSPTTSSSPSPATF